MQRIPLLNSEWQENVYIAVIQISDETYTIAVIIKFVSDIFMVILLPLKWQESASSKKKKKKKERKEFHYNNIAGVILADQFCL